MRARASIESSGWAAGKAGAGKQVQAVKSQQDEKERTGYSEEAE